MKGSSTMASSSSSATMTSLPWKYRLVEPHAAYVLVCAAFKILLPSLLKWLAYDTISTSILSVWYPICATISLIHRESQPSANTPASLQNDKNSAAAQERRFWIEYWTVGCSLAQCVHASIGMMPLFFTWSQQYSFLPQVMAECKFLFFVWIFAMEPLLQRYHQWLSNEKQGEIPSPLVKRFLPLSILKRQIRPRLLHVQTMIADPISKENWQRFIHSKAHRILNLLVALQFLTEDWSDYLLQLLDECRSLLLLSPFLILPASLTRVGILYAQFVLPSARSLMARGKIIEVLYLQYWVLNIFLSTAIHFGSWLWWFVPFSTQIIFATWCYLTFPRTITEYYAVVEQELMTFGILSGESQLKVTETKTVQAIRAVVKRLPSANDAEGFRFGESDVDSRYGPRSQRKLVPRSQSAPATLLAISAIRALHDSAVLSPPTEEDDDLEEDDENNDGAAPPKRPPVLSKLSKSLPAKHDSDDRFMEPPLLQKNSTINMVDHLPPAVSIFEESDESSQLSTMAMVNIDLRSDNKKVYEEVEVEVTMKELSAARLKAAKYHPRSPSINNTMSSNRPAPYHSPLKNSIFQSMSDEQNLRPSLSSLALPPTLSTRTVSDTCTPRSNASCGFDISDIDTAASGLDVAESFDSAGAFYDGSKRAERQAASPSTGSSIAKNGSPEDIARRAARRSERIRQLQEKREQRKLNQLTESLLFMRSTSTDESDAGGRSVDSSFVSETSSSTGNQAITSSGKSQDGATHTRMQRRRQRSVDSERSYASLVGNSNDGAPHNNMRRRRQRSRDSDRSFTESRDNNPRKSSLPRYVQVDSSDGLRERRTRRSRSRDNTTLISANSDVAQ